MIFAWVKHTNTKIQIHKYANRKTQYVVYFLKRALFKDIKNYTHISQTHKYFWRKYPPKISSESRTVVHGLVLTYLALLKDAKTVFYIVSKSSRALWAISLLHVSFELRDWLTRSLLGSHRRCSSATLFATLHRTYPKLPELFYKWVWSPPPIL